MDSLNDFLQKTFYFGVGLTAYTIAQIEEQIGKLDESLTEWQTQTQQLVEELVQRGEQVVEQIQHLDGTATDWQIAPLRRRLLELLRGNQELADRLVEQTAEQNPDRSLIWVYEKVIHDLERDRGTF
jgi:polyhydroxyalkanoate synthesis regulator phasin